MRQSFPSLEVSSFIFSLPRFIIHRTWHRMVHSHMASVDASPLALVLLVLEVGQLPLELVVEGQRVLLAEVELVLVDHDAHDGQQVAQPHGAGQRGLLVVAVAAASALVIAFLGLRVVFFSLLLAPAASPRLDPYHHLVPARVLRCTLRLAWLEAARSAVTVMCVCVGGKGEQRPAPLVINQD